MSEHASHHEKIYSRPRVSALLDRAAAGTLVVVCAPAGYGKTTAVADYLASGLRDYTVVWLGMTEADNHAAHFWQRLCAALVGAGADDTVLKKIADPAAADPSEVLALFTDAVESIKDRLRAEKRWHTASRIAIVLDDFHLVRSASILRFVADAASLGVRKLKLFAVSRTFPAFPARVRRMAEVGMEELSFDRDEIAGWLEFLHPATPQFEVRKFSGGRISDMQVLAALSGNGVSGTVDREALTRIFERYAAPVQAFLLRISVLEEFPISLCAAAADCTDAEAAALMSQVADAGILMARGAIHHILRDFLREKLRAENAYAWTAALARVAEHYCTHGNFYAAASCCVRSSDARGLVSAMSRICGDESTMGMQLNEFARDEFLLRRELFERIPTDILRLEAPLLEIFYVYVLIQLRDMRPVSQRIGEMRAHYAPLAESGVRNRVLGELEFFGLMLAYNDFEAKKAAFARARALLDGPSIFSRSAAPMLFSSPSILLLYYNEYRPLDAIADDYSQHWVLNDGILEGSFSGLGELLRAEVAVERADFAIVEALAGHAIERTRQYGVVMAAHFLLARLAIQKGRLDDVFAHLREVVAVSMREKKEREHSTVDFCFGLVGAILGEPEIAPAWLRNGELAKSRSLAVGLGIRLETFPYAFLLASCGRWDELSRALPEIRAGYERAQTRIGLLLCAIYDAMLHEAAGAKAAAEDALRAAWRMAEPDGLVMPFVERSAQLYPLVLRLAQAVKRADGGKNENGIFAQWILRMEVMMKRRNRTTQALHRAYLARRGMLRGLLGTGDTGEAEGDRDFLPRTLFAALSPREAEVYALREAGAGAGAISVRLGLWRDNVKNILLRVKEKTGLFGDACKSET